MKLLEPTLDEIVIDRPSEKEGPKQHLCVDKGYAGQPAQESIQGRGTISLMFAKGERKLRRRKRILAIVLADGWWNERIRG